jgi:Ca2+-binding RTX toxin-like protein
VTPFNRSSKFRSAAGRALRFELFEDRRLLSATPLAPAGTAEGEMEAYAASQVKLLRDFMVKVHDFAPPDKSILGVKGHAKIVDGNLVVYGTNVGDIIKVQEYPPLYGQNGLAKPGEVFVDVNSKQSGRLRVSFNRTDIFNNTIFVYGKDGADNIEFVAPAGTTMHFYVDGGQDGDTITGGQQGDFLDGGVQDSYKDSIYGRFGDDIIAGGGGDDLLFGDADGDLLWAEAGKDTLRGGTGDDDLFGGADDDKIYGDSENDWLFGGLGKDWLNGEIGADYLDGGVGEKDTLYGGTENDRFRVDGTEKKNLDRARDFKDGDKYVTSSGVRATSLAMTAGGVLAGSDAAFDVGRRTTMRHGLRF